MHVNCFQGVVCTTPTAGSAGVISAVLTILSERKRLSQDQMVQALMASGAIGIVVAMRAPFAAKSAVCQAGIGASGAMARQRPLLPAPI